ncbi:hypothetical protein E3J79_02660 [Candidatus Dependentiae bacterium]|nr:MAG: hypothetical protein E3J79_02660 [Candidatus Dependentiae bacterium]
MKHEIIIKRDPFKAEEYQKKGDNLGNVWIIGPGGVRIKNPDYRIEIFLSKNGLIGLGTELIRLAYSFKEGKHSHIYPISKDEVCQAMGIFLTPDSNELIICCDNLGTLDDYVK